MARDPIDRNNPIDRRMIDDFKEQRDRISHSPGGIEHEARRLGRNTLPASDRGEYEPSKSLEKQWRSIYSVKSREELRAEQDLLDTEEERLHLSEYRDEAAIGLNRMQRALVAELLAAMSDE